MFFLITITSAVAFTSIGAVSAFWINKESEVSKNFPEAFFYASDKKDYDKLNFIENSLKKQGYNYTKVQGEIKTLSYKKDNEPINIINESTYNIIAKSLGKEIINIKNNEVVLGTPLRSSKDNNILIDNMELKIDRKLEERVIPALYDNLYIVNDNEYNRIKGSIVSFCAFNVENYKDTLDICKSYINEFGQHNYKDHSIILMKADVLEAYKIGYGVMMFLSIFIGIIFFVTTGSFIYNKYYMDVREDRVKYEQLNKIGLTFKEIKKISTIEIGVLFLFPYIVSVTHSLFALLALKNAFDMEVSIAAFFVMGSFFIIQIIYFLIIRQNYILEIRRNLRNRI
ncbi:hypothetical protein [Clostridium sp. Marseille-Q2269]|uniref:hypothetical protein n=1 Tax=Clostridium sp. Marseille-Q2269 TaxID=2942205 RepID=UPI0020744E25|nr:hypothetical protein [Clostridium sp. Marseille-Q2269]